MSQNACWQILAVTSSSSAQTKSYLTWYTTSITIKKDVWIQSGSATDEGGFGKPLRNPLERASSDRNKDDSSFYHSFPSKLSAHSTAVAKEG
jgi:hypothetical protein